MPFLRPLTLALAALVALALPASAGAHFYAQDTGFRLSAAAYTVPQTAGDAVITIERTDTAREAQIRYETLPGTAIRRLDYTPVKSMIDFLPGQSSASFSIPIVNHNAVEIPKTIRIALFGPHSEGVGTPYTATLTITTGAVATDARNPLNPLDLTVPPPASDPLRGATPFIDWRDGLADVWQRRLAREGHPAEAAMMGVIAREPEVHRWGNWTGPHVGLQVSQYLTRTQTEEPGTVPEFATYYLVQQKRIHPECHHYSDPPWRQRAYLRWVRRLAAGVGNFHAIMFEEMDSLITVGCLSHHGLTVRLHELREANEILSKVPHLVVYEDAGAADALPAPYMASLLRRAGVNLIQGFFLNSTHFDWTMHEVDYGEVISRLTGGTHFVVNTAENGQGPLHPRDRVKDGNEIICDPPGRGLGPLPTFNTGLPNVDAFAWIANPGKSGGGCGEGYAPIGDFDPRLALELVRHRDFKVR